MGGFPLGNQGAAYAFDLGQILAPPGAFCFGTTCPCANNAPSAGSQNAMGSGGVLITSDSASVADGDLELTMGLVNPNELGLFFTGTTQVGPSPSGTVSVVWAAQSID